MRKGLITELRTRLGLSQTDLSDAFGLAGQNVISRWETGRRKPSELIRRLFLYLEGLPEDEARRLVEKFRSFGSKKRG